jgi:hypothetical protein
LMSLVCRHFISRHHRKQQNYIELSKSCANDECWRFRYQ